MSTYFIEWLYSIRIHCQLKTRNFHYMLFLRGTKLVTNKTVTIVLEQIAYHRKSSTQADSNRADR
jgi:hypothetical protein